MSAVLYALSVLIQIFILGIGLYHCVIGVFAFIERKKKPTVSDKENVFALVVAAHNEHSVIRQMVESLANIEYDREKFDIFVVADNCTDDTAEIAAEAGAIVHERFSSDKRGKGYALDWMFERIFAMEKKYDAICIFDADNIVDSKYLIEMNKKLNEGYKAVQCYVDTKNPNDSWVTASFAISFWCLNKVFQTARSNLGLSNQINGTGFALRTEVLKEIGWGATCLTEDMEFTMKLILNNIKVGWAKKAVIYDEKPLTLSQSFKQRTRWMQGHTDVASRFIKPLAKKWLKENDWAAFDGMIYLFQPMLLVAMLISTTMSLIQLFYPQTEFWFTMNSVDLSPTAWNLIMLAQLAVFPFILWVEKKLSWKIMFYYIPYIAFTYTWMPIAAIGMAKKNQKEWFHTQHTRKISIEEMGQGKRAQNTQSN